MTAVRTRPARSSSGGGAGAGATPPSGGEGRPRRRRTVSLVAWLGLLVAVLAVLALLLVRPVQTLLDQRDRYAETSQKLDTIRAENDRLRTRITALQEPAEIVRTAREQNQRVPNGVRAVIVQPAPPPAELPRQWPFTLVDGVVAARLNDGTASASTTTTAPRATTTTAPAPAPGSGPAGTAGGTGG